MVTLSRAAWSQGNSRKTSGNLHTSVFSPSRTSICSYNSFSEKTFHKVLVPSSRDLFSLSLKSIIHSIPSVHGGIRGFGAKVQRYLSTLSSTRGDNKGQALEDSYGANESISIKTAAIKNRERSVVAAQREDGTGRTGKNRVIEVSLIFQCRGNAKPELCQTRRPTMISFFLLHRLAGQK